MTTDTALDTSDARIHRALASPARARLLELLEQRTHDVAELADHLDLHVNTVRGHLKVLEDARLIRSSPEQRHGPGRPRLTYTAVEPSTPRTDPGYRLLAEMFVGFVGRELDEPERRARQLGSAWGRYLVDTPPPSADIDSDAAIQQVVELLGRLGFDPSLQTEADGRVCVRLRRCPFLEVAREHPDVVCSVHLGLMRGAFEGLGADVEVSDLIPFSDAASCIGHLEARE